VGEEACKSYESIGVYVAWFVVCKKDGDVGHGCGVNLGEIPSASHGGGGGLAG